MTPEKHRLKQHNLYRAAKCRAIADEMFEKFEYQCPDAIAIIRKLQQQLYDDADALEFAVQWIR